MIEFICLAIIILLIILWVSNIWRVKENFDTYFNHDMGSYDVYKNTYPTKPKSLEDANLYAKYSWEEKDRDGRTVYDKYYEKYNFTIGGASPVDGEYAYRDISSLGEDNVYDEKFSLTNYVEKDGFSNDNISNYHFIDMWDKHPALAYDWQSNELSLISQKNY